MSSILKALKKLENEAPEKSETHFWHPTKFSEKPADSAGLASLDVKIKILLFFSLSVIAFIIGLTLSFKMRPKTPVVATQTKSTIGDPLNVPEKRVVETRSDSVNLPSGKILTKSKTKINFEEKPARFTKSEERPTPTPTKYIKPGSIKASSPPNKTISTQKSVPQNVPIEKYGKKPAQNTKTRWSASIPVKQAAESQLNLQAIAWAKDPKSRLAVINGRVVREGEFVDRVMVLHIDKDQVVFKKGMESWRQLFRLK